MPKGVWVWPPDQRGQRFVLRKVAGSSHLMAALAALAKSKEGMSNAQLADAVGDGSEWTTLWVVRQLTALGFIEFKVDFFGNPNRYELTDQGRSALSLITGQPVPKPVPAPPAPATQPQAAPRPPAQTPPPSAAPLPPKPLPAPPKPT